MPKTVSERVLTFDLREIVGKLRVGNYDPSEWYHLNPGMRYKGVTKDDEKRIEEKLDRILEILEPKRKPKPDAEVPADPEYVEVPPRYRGGPATE